MRETLRAFQQIARIEGVQGAALVGRQNHMLSERIDGELDGLERAIAALRAIFLATEPRVRSLDLRFRGGRLLVVPVGEALLVLRATDALSLGAVLEDSRSKADAFARFGVADEPALSEPPAPLANGIHLPHEAATATAPPAAPAAPQPGGPAPEEAALRALGRVIEEARKVLGGPVLRNYLRRTQRELADRWPWLASLEVDLGAAVIGDVRGQHEVGLAMGTWTRSMLQRAAAVVPELGKMNIEQLTEDLREPLLRTGFYEGLRTQGGTL